MWLGSATENYSSDVGITNAANYSIFSAVQDRPECPTEGLPRYKTLDFGALKIFGCFSILT
jgi:hypothetical protein